MVRIKELRFPDRDHPRAVVALQNWTDSGYQWMHLTRPVAVHARRGPPDWMYRAVAFVQAHIDGTRTAAQLSELAEKAHRGRGIRRT